MSSWVCYALNIDDGARDQIHEWVQAQEWPEGTVLKGPETYHVTVVYSFTGYHEPACAQLFHVLGADDWDYRLRTASVDEFTDIHGKARPVVLRLEEAPDDIEEVVYLVGQQQGYDLSFTNVCRQAIEDAKEIDGLKVSAFDGGYKPHITVAMVPSEAEVPELAVPDVLVPLDHTAVELHEVYDRRKGEAERRETPR